MNIYLYINFTNIYSLYIRNINNNISVFNNIIINLD